jgi:hypothetical protein
VVHGAEGGVRLLPSVVMTFPEDTLCPLCQGPSEWQCLDDGEFVWRCLCLECGHERLETEKAGLL